MALDYSNFGSVVDNGNASTAPFANLSTLQSLQSLQNANQAAKYADPFMAERAQYQKKLSDLISNPGGLETSPYYQYLKDSALNAVSANNAARGLTKSGAGLMALQDRAQQIASQAYFPQVQALSNLAGVNSSSPAAAGIAFTGGVNRSQDQAQMAQAARSYQPSSPPAPMTWPSYGGVSPSPSNTAFGTSTGLPSGGYYGGQNPSTMTNAQLQTEANSYSPGGINYSGTGAGTGYVSSSNGGLTTFDNGIGTYDPYGGYGSSLTDLNNSYAIDPYSYDQNYG